MKKTIIAAAALVAMVGCNKNLIETPTVAETEYGYINLGVSADTEMVVTKGVTTEQDGLILEGYNINIKNSEGVALSGWPKEYEAIKDTEIKVPAGRYTVEVENLTDAEAHKVGEKGFVRVLGTGEVNVNAGLPADCPVACAPVNSKISFNYTEDFLKVFPQSEVTAGTSERTLPMNMLSSTAGTDNLDAAYFPAGSEITWTLTTTNASGTKTYSNKEAIVLTQAKWTVVTFNVGSVEGSINVQISVNGEITEVIPVDAVIDPLEGVETEPEA